MQIILTCLFWFGGIWLALWACWDLLCWRVPRLRARFYKFDRFIDLGRYL